MEKSGLIFITGGARSGKSSFAEDLSFKMAGNNGGNLHYIATCKPADDEMRHRIDRHKREREKSNAEWKTWECPTDIKRVAHSFQKEDTILLDCLTILLTNELFHDGYLENSWNRREFHALVTKSILTGIMMIEERVQTLVIVSNDVLYENITGHSLVQTYGRLLGYLHQQIVKRATMAFAVESGIPVLMKGDRSDERNHDSWNCF